MENKNRYNTIYLEEPIFIGGVGESSGGNGVVVGGAAAPVIDIAALDQVLEVDA